MAEIVKITNLNIPGLDPYRNTSELELLKSDPPLLVAESPKVVRTALDAGLKPVSLLAENKYITGQASDIVERVGGVPVYAGNSDVLTELTGFKLTQGLLCAFARPVIPAPEEVLKTARRIAVLEDVMNQTNIGAIFRSAAALNFDAVLLTQRCSDPYFRRTVRVSMGTVFQIPWAYLPAENYITYLQNLGFVCAAMALRDDTLNIDDKRLCNAEKLAVVLGTEGTGLKDLTISQCDYTVKIPMGHGVDSLNVAAASAVAFWALGIR